MTRSATRRCAVCNRKKARHLYLAHQWKLKTKQPTCKSCYKKSPGHVQSRDTYLRNTYGISFAEYLLMLTEQQGRCFICQRKPGVRSLAVDHDHTLEDQGMRNSVRGLLCRACNEYIGQIGDDPQAAARMVGYLTRPTWINRKR